MYLNKELLELAPALSESKGLSSEDAHRILDRLENILPVVFDFRTKSVIHADQWQLQEEDISTYPDYLENIVGLTPFALKECKGDIIITDSMLGGYGLLGFLIIIQRLSAHENIDILKKIHIIDVCHEPFEDKSGKFKDKRITNVLIEKEEFLDFSYNYLPDQSFFFPPWSWRETSL